MASQGIDPYSAGPKPLARRCRHFTFPWNNHGFCISCEVWEGQGEDQGLPCLEQGSLCRWCSFWSPELRSLYRDEIIKRLEDPYSYGPGRRYVYLYRVNGPLQLCRSLDLRQSAFSSSEDEDWCAKYEEYCRDSGQPTRQELLPELSSGEAARDSSSPPSGEALADFSAASNRAVARGCSRQPDSDSDTLSEGETSFLRVGSGSSRHSEKGEALSRRGRGSTPVEELGESSPQVTRDTSDLGDRTRGGSRGSSIRHDTEHVLAEATRGESPSTSRHEFPTSHTSPTTSGARESTLAGGHSHRSRGRGAEAHPEGKRVRSIVVPVVSQAPTSTSQRPGTAAATLKRHKSESHTDRDRPSHRRSFVASEESEVDVVGLSSGSDWGKERALALKVLSLAQGGSSSSAERSRGRSRRDPQSSPESSSEELAEYRHGGKRVRRGASLPTQGVSQAGDSCRDQPRSLGNQPPEVTTSRGGDSLLELSPTGSVTLSADQLRQLLASMQESSASSSEESPSMTKKWRDFRQVVQRYNLEVPEPAAPRLQYRSQTQGSAHQSFALETQRLPLYPDTLSTMTRCVEAIRSPRDPKTGYSVDPLGLGKYLEPQWPVSTKLDILDTPGFIQPLKRNTNIPKDILSEASTKEQSLSVNEKTLWAMEKQARQLACAWSAMRWSHRATRQVLDDEERSEEEKWADLDAILQTQADLEPLMEDLITTNLTNTVLRRRDLLLDQIQAQYLTPENLIQLRGSSLDEQVLIQFPEELLKEERELRSKRMFLQALKPPRAAWSQSGQQTQTQATQPVTAQPQPQPSTSGYQSFKAKGKGRGSFPKGRGAGAQSSFTPFQGGGKANRGRGAYPKGKGKGRGKRSQSK
jgi:hypothetical protein